MADGKKHDEATKKPEKSAKRTTATAVKPPPQASPSEEDSVLKILKEIKADQKSYDQKVDSIMERLKVVEQNQSYEEYYDDTYYYEESDQSDCLVSGDETLTAKRKIEEDSPFASMAKRARGLEVTGENIEPCLAQNLNELFREGMDEEQYQFMVKDDNIPRPGNCEGLTTVKVNRVVWEALSTNSKITDKRFQNAQTALVKGSIIISRLADDLVQHESSQDKGNITPLIEKCKDALSLFGHSNRLINIGRREVLKPDIKDYKHLCNPSVPITSQLFGDDLSQTIKEIDEGAKLGNKIQHGRGFNDFRGRARGIGFRGRPFRGRGRGTVRSATETSGYGHSLPSKNFPRRGARGTYRN